MCDDLSQSNSGKRMTIWDIARIVGVSQTTVSKALLNKSGVSDETRERILRVANAQGYTINRTAQSLSRQLKKIGVVIEQCSSPYVYSVLSGMEYEFKKILDYNIQPIWGRLDEIPSEKSVMSEIEALIENNIDGVILCPNMFNYRYVAQRLMDRNIPLITVTTDIEQGNLRLCCVADNADIVGRMGAEQLEALCEEGDYAILTSYCNVIGQKKAIAGFKDYLSKHMPASRVRIYETKTDNDLAYAITGEILRDLPRLKGIFYSSSPYHGSCQRICDEGLQGRVVLVGVDVYDEIIPFIERGVLKYTFFKNPFWQGRMSVQAMYEYLTMNIRPLEMIMVNPRTVSKTNLDAHRMDNIHPF